ncbi:zillion different screens protein [Lodderomyces elongisporus]|uniref:zillion different screens protein n=1 Tax=Lodderomyces elongisporus TaxID=36914 RepID=UPI002920A8AE|nr:zillion different screens protein [Lodderomyces elongisporus]WLF80614.1 zillion different screens protein [Lodderomyces elongisporus]
MSQSYMSSQNDQSQNSHYESAVQDLEKEKQMVTALKRMSIGHLMHYDPDLPPGTIDEFNPFSGNSHSSPSAQNHLYDEDLIPQNTQSPYQSTPLSSQGGASKSHARSSPDNKNETSTSNRLQTSSPPKRNSIYDNTSILTSESRDEYFDAEEDHVYEASGNSVWVPANMHPQINPDSYNTLVKNQVEEILDKKLSRQKSQLSRKSTLSRSSSVSDATEVVVHRNSIKGRSESPETENLGLTSGTSSSPSRSTSRSASPQKDTSSKRESWYMNHKRFSNPSLKELTSELEQLSKKAGLDKSDAVTVARTLSSNSLGYTDVEKMAFDELSEADEESATSSTLYLQQRLQQQFQITPELGLGSEDENENLEEYEHERKQEHDHDNYDENKHEHELGYLQEKENDSRNGGFALKRSRRPNYRKKNFENEASPIPGSKETLPGTPTPTQRKYNTRNSQYLFSYKKPTDQSPDYASPIGTRNQGSQQQQSHNIRSQASPKTPSLSPSPTPGSIPGTGLSSNQSAFEQGLNDLSNLYYGGQQRHHSPRDSKSRKENPNSNRFYSQNHAHGDNNVYRQGDRRHDPRRSPHIGTPQTGPQYSNSPYGPVQGSGTRLQATPRGSSQLTPTPTSTPLPTPPSQQEHQQQYNQHQQQKSHYAHNIDHNSHIRSSKNSNTVASDSRNRYHHHQNQSHPSIHASPSQRRAGHNGSAPIRSASNTNINDFMISTPTQTRHHSPALPKKEREYYKIQTGPRVKDVPSKSYTERQHGSVKPTTTPASTTTTSAVNVAAAPRSQQLRQNLDLLRSEINEFKESLNKSEAHQQDPRQHEREREREASNKKEHANYDQYYRVQRNQQQQQYANNKLRHAVQPLYYPQAQIQKQQQQQQQQQHQKERFFDQSQGLHRDDVNYNIQDNHNQKAPNPPDISFDVSYQDLSTDDPLGMEKEILADLGELDNDQEFLNNGVQETAVEPLKESTPENEKDDFFASIPTVDNDHLDLVEQDQPPYQNQLQDQNRADGSLPINFDSLDKDIPDSEPDSRKNNEAIDVDESYDISPMLSEFELNQSTPKQAQKAPSTSNVKTSSKATKVNTKLFNKVSIEIIDSDNYENKMGKKKKSFEKDVGDVGDVGGVGDNKSLKKKKSFGLLTHHAPNGAGDSDLSKLKKKKSWNWLRERSASMTSLDMSTLPPVPTDKVPIRSFSNPEGGKSSDTNVKQGDSQLRRSSSSQIERAADRAEHVSNHSEKENVISKLFKKKSKATLSSAHSIQSRESGQSGTVLDSESDRDRDLDLVHGPEKSVKKKSSGLFKKRSKMKMVDHNRDPNKATSPSSHIGVLETAGHLDVSNSGQQGKENREPIEERNSFDHGRTVIHHFNGKQLLPSNENPSSIRMVDESDDRVEKPMSDVVVDTPTGLIPEAETDSANVENFANEETKNSDSKKKRRQNRYKKKKDEDATSVSSFRKTESQPHPHPQSQSQSQSQTETETETEIGHEEGEVLDGVEGVNGVDDAAVSSPTPAKEQLQKQDIQEKLQKAIRRTSKANQPIQFTDSAFGFPLPPPSQSTIVMLDYRFPVHVERAIYRLSHLKLANPKRSLREQVLLSNFMYAYLNLVDHTLHVEHMSEEGSRIGDDNHSNDGNGDEDDNGEGNGNEDDNGDGFGDGKGNDFSNDDKDVVIVNDGEDSSEAGKQFRRMGVVNGDVNIVEVGDIDDIDELAGAEETMEYNDDEFAENEVILEEEDILFADNYRYRDDAMNGKSYGRVAVYDVGDHDTEIERGGKETVTAAAAAAAAQQQNETEKGNVSGDIVTV